MLPPVLRRRVPRDLVSATARFRHSSKGLARRQLLRPVQSGLGRQRLAWRLVRVSPSAGCRVTTVRSTVHWTSGRDARLTLGVR